MRSPRWLVLHLPAFRVERCGHGATDLVALTVEEHGGTRLCAVSPEATARGLRAGMTAAEARSLEPDVKLEPLDAAAEDEDRMSLLRALERLSDTLWPLADDAFALEISRVPRGDATLEAALALAAELGHVGYAVIADDPDAAYALCSLGSRALVVEPLGTAAAIGGLPVQSLRPSVELLHAWREVGVASIGDLARLPPSAVRDRYGPEGVRLFQIARGKPTDQVLRASITAKGGTVAQARTVLPGPTTTTQPLWFAIQGLIGKLAEQVARQDRAIVRLLVQIELERSLSASFRVRSGRPTASADRLRALVRPRVEALRVEAPALEVTVVAEETCPLRSWQASLYDRAEAQEPLPDLLARLSDALGEGAVFTPQLAPSWRPERAFICSEPLPLRLTARAHTIVELPQRPILLEATPKPIEVRTEADRPVRVRFGEGWEVVLRARGPEHLSGDWWRPNPFDRAYWVVDFGIVAWLYLDLSDGRWFLHGWYD